MSDSSSEGSSARGSSDKGASSKSSSKSLAFKTLTWILALGCFYLVYTKIVEAGARAEPNPLGPLDYLIDFFAGVQWWQWLALMIPYSIFFFLVDAHATWRVVRWFNVPSIKYTDILPIRGSSYILSMVNEQVGKGAMSLYLLRRHNVPGWEALSSMIFMALVEIYQLLFFSAVGVLLYNQLVQEASSQLPLNIILPAVFLLALAYIPIHLLYFSGKFAPNSTLRDKQIFSAFNRARPVQYLLLLLFKAPNLIMAVVIYTMALELFQVPVNFGQMLAFLPVIFLSAALPLPFHAGALLLWTVLFPNYPEVGAFSLVMHTFFVVFNALLGVLFLPKANQELFGTQEIDPASTTT